MFAGIFTNKIWTFMLGQTADSYQTASGTVRAPRLQKNFHAQLR